VHLPAGLVGRLPHPHLHVPHPRLHLPRLHLPRRVRTGPPPEPPPSRADEDAAGRPT
jgi:hypothetical protein